MMMTMDDPRVARFWLGLAFAILGVVILWMSSRPEPFPERDSLVTVSGTIAQVDKAKTSTRFRLAGDARAFRYLTKGGDRRAVHAALLATGRDPVTILVDRAGRRPPSGGEPFYAVYEISIGRKRVRTYEEVRRNFDNDDAVGLVLGSLFLGGGLISVMRGRRLLSSSRGALTRL